jgi:hypothetical protein
VAGAAAGLAPKENPVDAGAAAAGAAAPKEKPPAAGAAAAGWPPNENPVEAGAAAGAPPKLKVAILEGGDSTKVERFPKRKANASLGSKVAPRATIGTQKTKVDFCGLTCLTANLQRKGE